MRYFVESYGCTMNFGEGRQLSDRMTELGHKRVDTAQEADIVILNTCTVVDTTEKKMIKRMSELRKAGKQVIVTGCMAKVQPGRILIRLPDSIILPPNEYEDFSKLVLDRYGCGDSIPDMENSCFGIIPIAQGCLGNCTYCITKFARGNLLSYPEENIVREFQRLVLDGAKEILVTAQDTACYGRDTGTDLAHLISKMLETKGDYRIRIGMMNPNSLKPIIDDMLDAIEDPRVYKFFHIPVQSGSNDVLSKMKRHYTVEEFLNIVSKLRTRYPEVSISTDMITGFPEETEEDHRKSIDLIKELKADTVNITRFSPRPGTPAISMAQINGRISAERSAEMTDVKNITEYQVNSKLIGRTYRVLVTEEGKEGTVIARTENYRPIAVKGDIPLGIFIDVEVTGCASTYLVGRALNK
ncbi:MAG: tRNA (N(6)-L-threonylcarbamoyladenosine(37)-C(2))-methylthiotransferase [Candidatus Methanogranum gryphiswaldense]|nr:MAG: tRNA (N(6)-L-threonylcarbamoyladenosine(37)-C(2))-methylthiotransferase [Candidatus Methanogranum sp. U3.2.1]